MDQETARSRRAQGRCAGRPPGASPLTRRRLLWGAGAAALGLGLIRSSGRRALAQDATNQSAAALANVALPPDLGQADAQVYVAATGHTLRGTMLDYWRATGAASVYGNPMSEPFASAAGYYSQAFEHAVFQYRPEFLDTADPIVRLMPIGQFALQAAFDAASVAGRRGGGGGDRRSAAWCPLDPTGKAAQRALAAGGLFVEASGHTITGDLLAWYNAHEGPFYLGNPLSQPLAGRGQTLQYFEGGLLGRSEAGAGLLPLGRQLAPRLGIDTRPVAQGDLPAFDELALWTADNPNPQGDPRAPGPKWIEVSLSQQQLWAYHGSTLVSATLVSTGLAPNVTAPGFFHIRLKYPSQTMTGFTDSTGEVLGFGDAPPGTIPYAVKDIPNVMYFNLQAEALHGTYWHNNFGTPMSHGCVNLPLDVAAWMYGWAPLGTAVWIHD